MVTSLLRSSAIIIYDFMVKIPPLNGQTDRESAKAAPQTLKVGKFMEVASHTHTKKRKQRNFLFIDKKYVKLIILTCTFFFVKKKKKKKSVKKQHNLLHSLNFFFSSTIPCDTEIDLQRSARDQLVSVTCTTAWLLFIKQIETDILIKGLLMTDC